MHQYLLEAIRRRLQCLPVSNPISGNWHIQASDICVQGAFIYASGFDQQANKNDDRINMNERDDIDCWPMKLRVVSQVYCPAVMRFGPPVAGVKETQKTMSISVRKGNIEFGIQMSEYRVR